MEFSRRPLLWLALLGAAVWPGGTRAETPAATLSPEAVADFRARLE